MKNFKRFAKVFLVSLVAFALVACGNGKDSASGDGETYEIGVAIYKFDDNFMTQYREEIATSFAELGKENGNTYNLDVQDGKQDQSNQTEQIQNFIAQEKDLIIANMVDPTAAGTIIDAAKAADIPIIFINREPETQELEKWPGKQHMLV